MCTFKNLICICALALLVTGCKNVASNEKQGNTDAKINDCIERVIALDSSFGKDRNHDCEKISLSATITKYTNRLSELSYDGCAEEFKVAFQGHIKAWQNTMKVTDNYPDLRGEMHDLFDQINTTKDSTVFKPLVKDIWDTWADIEAAMKK